MFLQRVSTHDNILFPLLLKWNLRNNVGPTKQLYSFFLMLSPHWRLGIQEDLIKTVED